MIENLDMDQLKKRICEEIITPLLDLKDHDPTKNTLDPFSAVIDSILRNKDLSTWYEDEKNRQTQKTLQNKVGVLHEIIISCVDGWEQADEIIDVFNDDKKIIAEIKNKWNTTKGNHKPNIYDDIETCLKKSEYTGYTGYYVEILPKGKKSYNEPFTPSDNKKDGEKRPKREDIRRIDGKSFYQLISGKDDFIKDIYQHLPSIIYECLDDKEIEYNKDIKNDKLFEDLLNKTFDFS